MRPALPVLLPFLLAAIAIAALVLAFGSSGGDEPVRGGAPVDTVTANTASVDETRAEGPDVPPSTDSGAPQRERLTPPSTPGESKSPASPDEVSEPPAARVRGRVVDSRGAPVHAARVVPLRAADRAEALVLGGLEELREIAGLATRTNEHGEFDVALQDLGPFQLAVRHDEHPREVFRGRAEEPVTEGILITLRDGAEILGTVLGAPDGVPLAVFARELESGVTTGNPNLLDVGELAESFGAPIRGRRAEVGDDARFRIGGLDADGRYLVWAARTDGTAPFPVRCTARADVQAGARGVTLQFREPLTVAFRVVDEETGDPIEQLDVSAGFVREVKVLGMSVPIPLKLPVPRTSWPDGQVVLAELEPPLDATAELAIEVRASGYRPWTRDDVTVPGEGRVELGDVRLPRAAIVHVLVLAAATGAPCEGARVRLLPATDPADSASASESTGSVSVSTRISSRDFGTGESDPDVATPPRDPRSATTDAEGRCTITADFAGDGVLVVTSDDFAPFRSRELTIPSVGTVEQRVDLVAGGRARVRVVDGHGDPLPESAVVRTGPEDGDEETVSTDEKGGVTFEHLTPGAHTFAIARKDVADGSPTKVRIDFGIESGGTAARRVTIANGATVDVELIAPLECTVRGTVTLDGVPLNRATVRIEDPATAGREGETAAAGVIGAMLGGLLDVEGPPSDHTFADGTYRVEGAHVGPRRVVVVHDDLAMPAEKDVVLVEGENRVDVALRSTMLEGRVVDSSGAPVSGATVTVFAGSPEMERTAARLEDASATLGDLLGVTSKGVRTGPDGHFALKGLRSGTLLLLRVSARLRVSSSVSVDPLGDAEHRSGLEVVMTSAGRVRVTAHVEGAHSVRAEWAGDEPVPEGARDARTALLRGGRATIDGLPPGTWRLTLEGAPGLDERAPPRTVDLRAGETVQVGF